MASVNTHTNELNISFSGFKYFSYIYKGTNAPWKQRILFTDSLKKLKSDTLTFQCQIIVLKKIFDKNYIRENQYQNSNGAQYKRKEFIGNVNNQSIESIQSVNKEHKSSEIDELRQEIVRMNKKMDDMQQTINTLQFAVGTLMHQRNTIENVLENKMDDPGFDVLRKEKMKPIHVWYVEIWCKITKIY